MLTPKTYASDEKEVRKDEIQLSKKAELIQNLYLPPKLGVL